MFVKKKGGDLKKQNKTKVYLCMNLCSLVWLSVNRGQKKVGFPGFGDAGHCELPDVGAGNRTLLQE